MHYEPYANVIMNSFIDVPVCYCELEGANICNDLVL